MGKEVGRAQVSMEFLAVMGFILLMMIPLMVLFFTQSGELRDEVRMRQTLQIGQTLADSAESIYYLGPPSKTRLKLYMPNDITNVTLQGREIVFTVNTIYGEREIFWTSDVNLTGNLSSDRGIHVIDLQAVEIASGTIVKLSE